MDLARLAAAHGVATGYEDWQGRRVEVDRDMVRAVLGLLDVDTSSAAAIRAELAAVRGRPRTIVLWEGRPTPRVPDGDLWAAVRALPEKQRAAVTLRFAADLSHREIGRVLDCSDAAARRSVHEGLKRLREVRT